MIFLDVSGISKQQGNTRVLKDISFSQERFRKIAIAGETGSGKSTLLRIIAGLEQPTKGKVVFENNKVAGPDETLVPGHPFIGYLSQHYELRNNYRMEDLLDYATKISTTDAEKLFDVCRISHLLKRKNDQLSGGEKQRIALARLLVGSPHLLLLDEPFSNIDPIHKNILKSVLHDITEQLQITSVLTSHDPVDTLSWADEIIVMKEGQIIQKGSPHEVYHHPVNEYVAGLFGSYNLFSAEEAIAFPGLYTDDTKSFFIRPEQFSIKKENGNAVRGTIENIRFAGSYYELDVLIPAKKITIKTTGPHFKNGDTVYVSLDAEAVRSLLNQF